MSRNDKDALVAFVNLFKLSKRVTDFVQLADGKALMEVMNFVDETHFKNVPARAVGPSSSSENWVLRTNTLKRLYRLLLSYPLPAPHPPSLSLSSLPEPPFSSIAKSPSTREGSQGLLHLCRLCLVVGVWAPNNENVITKIQRLNEEHMAELMKSIEQIMATMPEEHQGSGQASPLKPSPDMSYSPPPSGLRAERDKLLQENDDLRSRCEQMVAQVSKLTSELDEAKEDRDDAMERLKRNEGPGAGLRTSQNAHTGESDRLTADLLKSEENLAHVEEQLEKQTALVNELSKEIEQYKAEAEEAVRLKDQLDEFRHTSDRLRKSENVIEKYRKKLEDSAGLRRELRNLEKENATLVNTNSTLQADLDKALSSKSLLDTYKSQITTLEKQTSDQSSEIAQLNQQLETAQGQLEVLQQSYDEHEEELAVNLEKLKELELSGGTEGGGGEAGKRGMTRSESGALLGDVSVSLDDELEGIDGGVMESKTDLRVKIKSLEREIASLKSFSHTPGSQTELSTVQALLSDATRSRDRYQTDYLTAHRETLRLSATLEAIRSGKGKGGNAAMVEALRKRVEELEEEVIGLRKEKKGMQEGKEEVEKALEGARRDLDMVGKDQRDILASLRENVEKDTTNLESQVRQLKDQIDILREKDRQNLEEIKKLLTDKVDLQSAGITQRERVLEKEKEFSELRATMSASGVPPETQQQLLNVHEKNIELSAEVKALQEKLLASPSSNTEDHSLFEAAQQAYESQIASLQATLSKLKQSNARSKSLHEMENQLMLGAWHDLGSRVMSAHLQNAGSAAGVLGGAGRRSQGKSTPGGWLGRQRRVVSLF
ncbi:hypothetical protein L202_04366 [Cryptococcus amylolentus CBS 6039]|uniref:HOOK N-terminal domain-containing protein n=2 Tax=Cryptococcus amylolentus TaxID=104669 RepID=A0A1E3HR65_9TREE|nr:hypothetical protein L202_04366 [Cryptococcus amylolentus CBS 6039]ODN78817.1 hypothetical protein L202_04366 [Cryptococcus amylolentus CBS 6039]ODO06695.1 hypothetical protein I350_04053 [Cryptococcus amylolentus CBS 6273]